MQADSNAAMFVPVADSDDLDNWVQRSHHAAVLLFLHDPWCPISGRANIEMKQVSYSPIAVVDVARQRDVTGAIQALTGIQHESPQVILLRDGNPIWYASHFAITAEVVERMLGFAATEPEHQLATEPWSG